MEDIRSFIDSGILESYVLGMASAEEAVRVEAMAAARPEVRQEIRSIQASLESYANSHSEKPHMTLKPLIMAGIDYMERMEKGETPGDPPVIYEHSRVEDYKKWLDREDMVPPEDYSGIFAKFICATPEMVCGIVWIKEIAPEEVHKNEHEKFLIVEGTCDIHVNDEVYSFVPGDVFSVPLHASHHVIVTSDIPCKVILQRVAA